MFGDFLGPFSAPEVAFSRVRLRDRDIDSAHVDGAGVAPETYTPKRTAAIAWLAEAVPTVRSWSGVTLSTRAFPAGRSRARTRP